MGSSDKGACTQRELKKSVQSTLQNSGPSDPAMKPQEYNNPLLLLNWQDARNLVAGGHAHLQGSTLGEGIF